MRQWEARKPGAHQAVVDASQGLKHLRTLPQPPSRAAAVHHTHGARQGGAGGSGWGGEVSKADGRTGAGRRVSWASRRERRGRQTGRQEAGAAGGVAGALAPPAGSAAATSRLHARRRAYEAKGTRGGKRIHLLRPQAPCASDQAPCSSSLGTPPTRRRRRRRRLLVLLVVVAAAAVVVVQGKGRSARRGWWRPARGGPWRRGHRQPRCGAC